MIRVGDLQEWMYDNRVDVLKDGPFDIDDNKEVEFVERIKSNKKLIKELIKEGFIDNKDELEFNNFSVSNDSIVDKLILTEFVDWLNQLQSEGISVWKKVWKR
jgi:hypothetical protein